ncbi:hypothetical protein I4U23_015747 [Adineta vaga]|nr:hypothetical protein I4U23_015747 [Adineta vaga]
MRCEPICLYINVPLWLKFYDSYVNYIAPVLLIAICSLTLLLRFIKQKQRIQQAVLWRHCRKITFQLVLVSSAYNIFDLPSILISIVQTSGYPTFASNIYSPFLTRMTLVPSIILAKSILCLVIHTYILLYDTETSDSTQYAYCIYWMTDATMKYCIRTNLSEIFDLDISNDCFDGSERWLFHDAIQHNISPSHVLTWSSSIELADRYAGFYYNDYLVINQKEFVCNCKLPWTFGPRCEFELLHGTVTFEDAIKFQFKQKENDRWGMQRHGEILCYQTIVECDYGLLCLDWRNICDGEQQCMNGTDENNCDLLEFNECEENEYRCVNGMCIAEEYWLDGNDEQRTKDTIFCPYTSGSFQCEESLCLRQQWSCGDGQCIWGFYRLSYKRDAKQYCINLREFNYICEIHPNIDLWSRSNGLCWNLNGYVDIRNMNNEHLSNASKCIYLIRCALSNGFEYHCPCNENNCSSIMPTLYINIKCRGFLGKTVEDIGLNVKDRYKLDRFPLIDHLFCNHDEIIRDNQSDVQYHHSCWNESLTFNNQSYAFVEICNKSYECISQYRIGDDYSDCGEDGNDLLMNNVNICSKLQKYRFQCSNDQSTCLPVRALGDQKKDCNNRRDEFIDGIHEPLAEIECKYRNDYGCRFLKDYINLDSHFNYTNGSSVSFLDKQILTFRSYCDTFWDLPFHFDEVIENCQQWICQRHQYQCQTGQCIEYDWFCDGEWDCPDASDEQAAHLNSKQTCRKRNKQQPFVRRCNVTIEYPCLLAHVDNPLNIDLHRPCINLTQIGDGREDCYGGLDEKNTLENCDGSMLGPSFRCQNQECFDFESLCDQQISHSCKDPILCFHRSQNESCSDKMDVLCLNDILYNHPYSVRFVICLSTEDEVQELGLWFYPIYFDFLPSFRLVTVLKFPTWYKNITLDPCMNNNIVCPNNSICQSIFNHKYPSFVCSCQSGFYGNNCENFDSNCSSYCLSNALCKPLGRGEMTNINNPLCICPLHHFGPHCYLHHDECHSQPCRNNGTCLLTSDPSGQRLFVCNCSADYHGDYCEKNKFTIEINLNMNHHALASIVQLYDIRPYDLYLLIQYQQVMYDIPVSIQFHLSKPIAPALGILKLYDLSFNFQYYILYIQDNEMSININTTPKHCLRITTTKTSVFDYHLLCRDNTELLCFHDNNYLCICEQNHTRVDCFGLDSSIDQCNYCFFNGKCLRGDTKNSDDFLCLCQKCSHGQLCEFTTYAFGFTLDSLLANDQLIIQIIYICLVSFLSMFGLLTNLCSLAVFRRPQQRKVTAGNYLYSVSILNQCALLFLLLKFIHIIGGFTWHYHVNLISCKIISYLLFVTTRATFWLTSWITCDRLHIVLFPSSTLFKRPNTAIRITIITLIIIAIMHIPDIVYTTTSNNKCIINFEHPLISLYNRFNTLLHYLGTFTIQTLSITILIILVARSRKRVTGDEKNFLQMFKTMFNTKKELYVTPIIIVLSAVPQTILSFSLSCSELFIWQRHILLPAYLLSYAPQILGFILFVLPSKGYRIEFQKTKLARTFV